MRAVRLRRRMRAVHRRVRGLSPRPAVLMYHRIGEEMADPWALSVSASVRRAACLVEATPGGSGPLGIRATAT